VTVGYRLAKQFPAAVHDVKCAVRWLRANAAAHRIDKERIGVLGFSSGGHLACMLGLTGGIEALEGNGGAAKESSAVCCVVCCAGLSDLEPLHESCVKGDLKFYGPFLKLALETFAGGPPAKAGDRYAKASPINYASKSAPPTLLIHGTEDSLIPIDQSKRLEKKLREAGAEVSLVPLKGAAHDFAGEHANRLEAAALEFLNRHLRQPLAKRR
jgi:acetyl esterase/lipase